MSNATLDKQSKNGYNIDARVDQDQPIMGGYHFAPSKARSGFNRFGDHNPGNAPIVGVGG